MNKKYTYIAATGFNIVILMSSWTLELKLVNVFYWGVEIVNCATKLFIYFCTVKYFAANTFEKIPIHTI